MTQLEYPYLLNVSKYIQIHDLANFRQVSKKCNLTNQSFINWIPLCFECFGKFKFVKTIYKNVEDIFKWFPNVQSIYISIITDRNYEFDIIIQSNYPFLKNYNLQIKIININQQYKNLYLDFYHSRLIHNRCIYEQIKIEYLTQSKYDMYANLKSKKFIIFSPIINSNMISKIQCIELSLPITTIINDNVKLLADKVDSPKLKYIGKNVFNTIINLNNVEKLHITSCLNAYLIYKHPNWNDNIIIKNDVLNIDINKIPEPKNLSLSVLIPRLYLIDFNNCFNDNTITYDKVIKVRSLWFPNSLISIILIPELMNSKCIEFNILELQYNYYSKSSIIIHKIVCTNIKFQISLCYLSHLYDIDKITKNKIISLTF